MAPRPRILAVDDNPRNLAIVERTLAGEFQIVTAASGEEALDIAPLFRPDLVILDIMMPGMDGYEACRRLRAIRALAACKIIMVSAQAATSDRLEGYAAGADDYLVKPFESDELLAKLRVYLRLKSVEELDRFKTDMLSLLSHETRTPLTAIMSPVELLLDDPSLAEKHRQLVAMIQFGGMRLLALFEKVLHLSRLKAGGVPCETALLHPEALATRAIAGARRKASREDVAVEFRMTRPVQLKGDANQLGSALEALLDNALRLSPPSAVVRLDVWNSGPWSNLAVSDQGPGIQREFIDRVFDEFVVEEILHHSKGHGLGLATARLIVEQHGGSLTVESEPGRGATFTMRLPAPEAMARAA